MAQVVAAGRQSLMEEEAALEAKMEAVEQEQAAHGTGVPGCTRSAEFSQRRVVLKLKRRFYDEASSRRLSLADLQPRARSPATPHCRWCCLLPAPSSWTRCPSGRSTRPARCSSHFSRTLSIPESSQSSQASKTASGSSCRWSQRSSPSSGRSSGHWRKLARHMAAC